MKFHETSLLKKRGYLGWMDESLFNLNFSQESDRSRPELFNLDYELGDKARSLLNIGERFGNDAQDSNSITLMATELVAYSNIGEGLGNDTHNSKSSDYTPHRHCEESKMTKQTRENAPHMIGINCFQRVIYIKPGLLCR